MRYYYTCKRLKEKILTISSAEEEGPLVQMQNSTANMGNDSGISYTVKHTLGI